MSTEATSPLSRSTFTLTTALYSSSALTAARKWEKIEDGRPRLGREAYFWEGRDGADRSESAT